jgi:hypothetical protein
MATARKFGALDIYIPGTYVNQQFPPAPGSGRASANIVAIIGESGGGVPVNANVSDSEKLNFFTNTRDVIDKLVNGNGMYGSYFYLTPSNDPNISPPTQLIYIRANNATKSSSEIQNSSNVPCIDLKSVRYGTLGNQIAKKVETGSVIGKKVTIKFRGQTIMEEDNITYEYLKIAYVGSGSSAELSISNGVLSTVIGTVTSDAISLNLSEYQTISDLVAKINEFPAYEAEAVSFSFKNPLTLDGVTNLDIFTEQSLFGTIQAVIDRINGVAGNEVEASIVSESVRTGTLNNDSGFISFTGGTSSVANTQNWIDAFTLADKFNINYVLLASGDPTVQSILSNHVSVNSATKNRKNRQGGSGALLGDNFSTKLTRARLLNNARIEYFGTPILREDPLDQNRTRIFDPFYGAFIGAGIRFGNSITISATGKSANIQGVGELYSVSQEEQLIQAGVSYFKPSENGFEIGHNITTSQAENPILQLPSVMRTVDFISLDSIRRIDSRMKNLTSAPTQSVIKEFQNWSITVLLPSYINEGLLIRFQDVQFSLVGDSWQFEFTGIVPAPLHYAFVTQKFVLNGFDQAITV